jgi:hypothetical protein
MTTPEQRFGLTYGVPSEASNDLVQDRAQEAGAARVPHPDLILRDLERRRP